MKKQNTLFAFIFMFAGLCFFKTQAQLDTAFFQKLQTEKVTSDTSVSWTQFGPGMAGYCEEFWIHPTDNNFMYQSPDMSDSYYTENGGDSWLTLKDEDGTGHEMKKVRDISFSRQNPNFGFALDTRGNLMKTTNKGRDWVKTNANIKRRHSQIEVDPTNDNIWYIGAGSFWDVKSYHRSKANPQGHTYQFAEYGYIYKSTDKGVTWTKKTNGLPSTLDVARIIIDPRNTNNIIIASKSGIYRSTDKGESWVSSAQGLPNNLPKDLTSYYNANTNEFVLYTIEQPDYQPNGNTIISNGGIYKSTDGGVNWTNINGNLALDLTAITNYTTRDKYQKTVAFWLGKTKTQIATQYPQYPTSIIPNYNRIVVNPLNKNEIYISNNVKHDKSFGPGDVWKTENGGTTWFACTRTGTYWKEKKNSSYWNTRNNPSGINTKFAHLQPYMDSHDETWGNRFLAINSKGEVFICLEQQILKSSDNGSTWEQIDDIETAPNSKNWIGRGASNLPGRFMLLETGIPGRKFFCSGEHGLWESAPLGDYAGIKPIAVKQIEGQVNENGARSIASVAVHPTNPNIIYTLQFRQDHRGYFRKSIDGGKTWVNVSEALVYNKSNIHLDHLFQYSLTIDYNNADNIYFTAIANPIAEVEAYRLPGDFTDTGVYKSSDGGVTWNMHNNGLPNDASVRRIKMHPSNSNTLYAALNIGRNGGNGGLYKSTNKAQSWSKIAIPNNIKAVNNVFIDRNTNYIFISCGAENSKINEGGVWRSKDNGDNWEKIFDMPYIWQTETSPINSNIIVVNAAMQNEYQGAAPINPGAYLSKDGGSTWVKINNNLGRPNHLTDIKPDPVDENVLWCASFGQSWYKGIISPKNDIEETVSFDNFNPKIIQKQSLEFNVNYSASQERDVVVILTSPTGQWLANSKVTVSKGQGTQNVILNLIELPEIADNYKITAAIRTVGGNFDSNIAIDQRFADIVLEELQEESISFNNLPQGITPTSSIPVEITYSVLEERDLVAILTSPTGQWLGNGKLRVQTGSDTKTVTINTAQPISIGTNYKISIAIRPVGATTPAEDIITTERLINITLDTVNFGNLSNEIEQSKSINIPVEYDVSEDRNIVAILNSPTGKWLTNKKIFVAAGSGTTSIELTLLELPQIDTNYKVTVVIRPIGGSNTENLYTIDRFLEIITSTSNKTLSYSATENSNEIIFYPNPTKDIIKIKTTEKNESWKIFNSLGTLVHSGNKNTIDLSHLASGNYIIKYNNTTYRINKL